MTKTLQAGQRDAAAKFTSVKTVAGRSSVVLVCEHASCFMPAEFKNLGVDEVVRKSHVAWDPGALAVAEGMAAMLDGTLVAGQVSRLIYDCNRPPEAPDAMPDRSEVFDIPGNAGLSAAERDRRVAVVYRPFQTALQSAIASLQSPVVVTIHSFTPVYKGENRATEIGVLHDVDSRLADAMLDLAPHFTDANVQRNQPYGPENGVTHTLREHAVEAGHLNVMLEIRNDLIDTAPQQEAMAKLLAVWVARASSQAGAEGDVQCKS